MILPAYCITLRQTPERTAWADAQFKREGIPVSFLDGFHGASLGIRAGYPMHQRDDSTDTEGLKALLRNLGIPHTDSTIRLFLDSLGSLGYYLAPGKTALALSHMMAWEVARLSRASSQDCFIVFEDDVILPLGFKQSFSNALAEVQARDPDWDILFLEHCCADDTPERPGSLVAPNRYPMCTAAYVVRYKAIPTLRQAMEPLNSAVDILIKVRALPKLSHWITTPQLVRQATADGIAPPVPCALDYYPNIEDYYI